MTVELRSELAAPAGVVFDWHARPGAFERLVPPWEPIRLIGAHPGLVEGARVSFQVPIGPFERTWVARHESVEAGRSFVDVQEQGPFARWRHTHRFEALSGERSALTDAVDFELPGGPLGDLAEPIVRRRLRRTLRYRHAVTAGDIALHQAHGGPPRTVAMTGASGLLGSTLAAMLTTGGHTVIRLVRRPPGPGEVQWDPAAGTVDPAALAGVDAVIHLAGESIAGSRWTPAHKARIRASRVEGTGAIARAMAAASPRPSVLIQASAVGIYGDRGDEVLAEDAPAGEGFLAEVGAAWEAAAEPATRAGIRTVAARFGIVLSPAGGALDKMLLPFRLGAGSPLGSGRQWMSWISIDDCAGALIHLMHSSLEGPVNVVAPEPVTNAAFTDTLGDVLRRPTVLPGVPAGVLRLVIGELADEGLLASARVIPSRLVASGYSFRHSRLADGLAHVLGRKRP